MNVKRSLLAVILAPMLATAADDASGQARGSTKAMTKTEAVQRPAGGKADSQAVQKAKAGLEKAKAGDGSQDEQGPSAPGKQPKVFRAGKAIKDAVPSKH